LVVEQEAKTSTRRTKLLQATIWIAVLSRVARQSIMLPMKLMQCCALEYAHGSTGQNRKARRKFNKRNCTPCALV